MYSCMFASTCKSLVNFLDVLFQIVFILIDSGANVAFVRLYDVTSDTVHGRQVLFEAAASLENLCANLALYARVFPHAVN